MKLSVLGKACAVIPMIATLALFGCGGGGGDGRETTQPMMPGGGGQTGGGGGQTGGGDNAISARLPAWPAQPQFVDRGQPLNLDPIPGTPTERAHVRREQTRNTINLGSFACGTDTCGYEDDAVVSYRGIDFVQQRGVFLKEHLSGSGIDDSEDIYWQYYRGYLNSGRVIHARRTFNTGYNEVVVSVFSDQSYRPDRVRGVSFGGTNPGGSDLWTDNFGTEIVTGQYSGAMLGVDVDNGNFLMGDASISGRLVEVSRVEGSLPVFDTRFTNIVDTSSGRAYANIEGEIGYGGILFDPDGNYQFDRGDFVSASISFVQGDDEAVGSFRTDDVMGVFGAHRE